MNVKYTLKEDENASHLSLGFKMKPEYSFIGAHQELMNLTSLIATKKSSISQMPMDNDWASGIEHLKHIGLILVMRSIVDNLKIIRCHLKETIHNVKPPHNLFSWDLNDFLKRIEILDSEYIVDFQESYSEILDFIKLKCDIENIIDLLAIFIVDITERTNLSYVDKKLKRVFKFLKLEANIFDDMHINEAVAKTVTTQLKNVAKKRDKDLLDWDSYLHKWSEKFFEDHLILYPIKLRYIQSWETAQVAQLEKQKDNKNEVYLWEIREFKYKFLREQECIANIQDAYEVEIVNFEKLFNQMQIQYDRDYEVYDMQCTRARADLEEFLIKITKLRNKCEKYKDEMVKKIAKDKADEAERAWREQIEMSGFGQEEAEQAPVQKDAGKGKGKGKEKGKGKKK